MGLWDPSTAHVRDIQATGQGGVRIILDRVQQQEVTGKLDDDTVRQILLAAMQDATDPSVRVDSVQMLEHQSGSDVRDALLNSAKSDPNAAVRVKALEGLRQFTDDRAVRAAIENIVKQDSSPEVRSEAIDVLLAPATSVRVLTPDVITTLQELINSERQDDYVRSRSLDVLRGLNGSNPVF
jgi:HEAT repeat protein